MAELATTRPGFKSQLDTLIDRNLAIRFGALGTLAIFLLQAPLIGYMIGLAWQNSEPRPTTYFIMTIAAIYLGCMNACTAIVSERAIFNRERMFNLNLWSYLLAKLFVLAMIGAVQAGLLLLVQGQMMNLPSGLVRHGLMFGVLTLTGIVAAGLGLAISAFARTALTAVIIVPIFILPQIVFSKVVLQEHIDNKVPSILEKVTLTKWCYDGLNTIGGELEWLVVLGGCIALLVQLFVFLMIAAAKLKLDEP